MFTMPSSCCAVDCTKRNRKGNGIRFYQNLKILSKGCSIAPQPNGGTRLCWLHFVSGTLGIVLVRSWRAILTLNALYISVFSIIRKVSRSLNTSRPAIIKYSSKQLCAMFYIWKLVKDEGRCWLCAIIVLSLKIKPATT